jgi:thiamine kinase-like enzyme
MRLDSLSGETLMPSIIAFAGDRRIAAGEPIDVALEVKRQLDGGEDKPILVFDAATSEPVELDLRGDEADICARLAPRQEPEVQPIPSRGRPKLGVVAREVTLLPRQWDWLSTQRGGASAALRQLVSAAQREGGGAQARRQGQGALHRFITVMAGDAIGYEEATRALFAGDAEGFGGRIAAWPQDVRAHALALAGNAFEVSPLAQLVPSDRLAPAAAALRAAIGEAELTGVAPLTAGASGATVLRVEAGPQLCVLRLDGPGDGFRDAARQYACHAIAAQAGVAPRLLYADVEARLSVAAFLTESRIQTKEDQLAALALSLRKLHGAPLFPPLMPFLEAMERLIAGFMAADIAPAELSAKLKALFDLIRGAYRPTATDVVSSHNDLNPGNVLFAEGRAVLLDWETAFAADRFVDLAALANFYAEGEEHLIVILTRYFGRPATPAERMRLELMRQVSRLFYGVMLLSAVRRSDPDFKLRPEVFGELGSAQRTGPKASPTTKAGKIELACSFLAAALAARDTPAFLGALAQADRE